MVLFLIRRDRLDDVDTTRRAFQLSFHVELKEREDRINQRMILIQSTNTILTAIKLIIGDSTKK
jgi:hypothetical protein